MCGRHQGRAKGSPLVECVFHYFGKKEVLMRKAPMRLCAAFATCAFAASLVGCASGGAASSADNSLLNETSAELGTEQVLNTVSFGAYEQDGNSSNGAETIEWYVLDEQDGKSLLISKQVLDAVAYSDIDAGYAWSETSPRPTTDVEWADSSLRAWLNGEFFSAAFSADEQAAIASVTLSDTKNNATHTAATAADAGVHETTSSDDSVFVLSVAEAKSYFDNNAARVAYPTEYAIAQGAYVGVSSDEHGQINEDASGAAIWWLRTNGYYSGYHAVVTDDGYVHGDGYRSNGEMHDGFEDHGTQASELGGNMGVRPCIWVDTTALS